MSVTHGAQVDVLDQIAEQLTGNADNVEQIRQHANTAIGSLQGAWHGSDLDKFVGEWATSERQVTEAHDRLQSMAKALREQAQQQRSTSSTGSGSSRVPLGPGGGSEGPGGEGGEPEAGEPWEVPPWVEARKFDVEVGLSGLVAGMKFLKFGEFAPYLAKHAAEFTDLDRFMQGVGDYSWKGAEGLAENGEAFEKWAKFGERAEVAGGVIAGGLAAFDQWQSDSGKDMNFGERAERTAVMGTSVGLGAWGGAVAGGELGGAIGTFICPGVGTAVGAVLGGAIGGLAGSEAGKVIGNFVKGPLGDVYGAAWDGAGSAVKDVGKGLEDVGKGLGHVGSSIGHKISSWL